MRSVLLVLVCLLFAFSGVAAEWSLSGSVRIQSYYENFDKHLSGTGESDTDLNFGLQGDSRLDAEVKVNDKMSATVELGIRSSVKTRLFFATYDFGSFKLEIGQDYTPTDFEPFNQVYFEDNALDGFGGVSAGRLPQIKLFMGDLEIALVKSATMGDKNYDTMLPKIELAYGLSAAGVDARIFGGFNTYKYEKKTSGFDKSVLNYIVGAGATYAFAPATISAVLWYGQNSGDYGLTSNGSYNVAGDENSKDFGGAIEVGFTANDMLSFAIGYGYQQSDRDDFKKADSQQSYYANATITVANGFYIVPEVGVFDYMKDAGDNKEGKLTYVGAKWQMNF